MVGSMQTPIIPIGSGQTQELIAPVQDTLIAKQNYAQGQQFILGGALFTVTKSGGISVGDTINMNTDVEASDNITDQIMSMGRVKTVTESLTSTSSNVILLPVNTVLATVRVGTTNNPALLAVRENDVQIRGYFSPSTGAYTQLSASTSYTIIYSYVE